MPLWKAKPRTFLPKKYNRFKVAERPHAISICLACLSPAVATLALCLSYKAFNQSREAERIARLPKPYISQSNLGYEFRKDTASGPQRILLLLNQGYTIENSGQSTATIVRRDLENHAYSTDRYPLPEDLSEANQRDKLLIDTSMFVDGVNPEVHPGQRHSRQDTIRYDLGPSAFEILRQHCKEGRLNWNLIHRSVQFSTSNGEPGEPMVREWDTRVNERHLCLVLGQFVTTETNWLKPQHPIIP